MKDNRKLFRNAANPCRVASVMGLLRDEYVFLYS